MEQIKTYYFDEPIKRPVYDREDVKRYLDTMRSDIINTDHSEYKEQEFDYLSKEILNAVDFFLSRLQHSEMERFNR